MQLEINVVNKIARAAHDYKIVCGNSDYTILFTFDNEWDAHDVKTARFAYNRNGESKHIDVVFTGATCAMPMLQNITAVEIGVYAGDLRTTTPCILACEKSIICKGGTPEAPAEDVYAQIVKLCEEARETAKDIEEKAEAGEFGGELTDEEKQEIINLHPIKYVESLDTNKLVNFRDLETGTYILHGYFSPYANSDISIACNNALVSITRKDAGSHILCFNALNAVVVFMEILVDETAEKGYTYERKNISLLELHGLIDRVETLENKTIDATDDGNGNVTLYLENMSAIISEALEGDY